eukprot:TRINITY_DN12111_c0_g1_i11.p1 TRINITY_DN12111_c0_g1~~TRINITY_DN12111_c0_g1_i11.p1  ORF type:complete len:208 (+),score=17.82 TRINITY_DN12111_c0_g1_i11:153-776(+)
MKLQDSSDKPPKLLEKKFWIVDPNCTFTPDISISQLKVASKTPVKAHKCLFQPSTPASKLKPRYSKQSFIEMKLLGKRIPFSTKASVTSSISEEHEIPAERFTLYKATFELLDSDKDGKISTSRMDTTSIFVFTLELSTEALELYMALIVEVEMYNAEIDLHEFAQAAERLYQALSASKQEQIISLYSKRNNSAMQMNRRVVLVVTA